MKTECQSEYFGFGGKTYPCPLSVAMDLVGGKWKAVILYHLQGGAKRFGELHECLPGITETILSRLLKQLEHDELVSRQVFGIKPPLKTEYAALTALTDWGNQVVTERGSLSVQTRRAL